MNFLENITFRRKRNRTKSDRQTSQSDEDDISQTQNNETASSLPEISDDDSDEIQKLKDRILALQAELKSAHQEIEALSLQNSEFKRCNDTLQNTNELLLSMKVSKPTKSKLTPKKDDKHKAQVESPKNTNKMTDTSQKPKNKTTVNGFESEHEPTPQKITQTQTKQKKICLLSTNNHNKILSIAEDCLDRYSTLCHYIKSNSGLKNLLTGIDAKVSEFTMNDFCIVLVGDEEFKTTHNYFKIIADIRFMLQELKHTNVIICLPTYKYGNQMNMFNWRVETFNNLIYMDTLTHEHAYIFDTNKKLAYDSTMFNKYSCKVNDYGMEVIFRNLKNYIDRLQQYNNSKNPPPLSDKNNDEHTSDQMSSASGQSQFFRD